MRGLHGEYPDSTDPDAVREGHGFKNVCLILLRSVRESVATVFGKVADFFMARRCITTGVVVALLTLVGFYMRTHYQEIESVPPDDGCPDAVRDPDDVLTHLRSSDEKDILEALTMLTKSKNPTLSRDVTFVVADLLDHESLDVRFLAMRILVRYAPLLAVQGVLIHIEALNETADQYAIFKTLVLLVVLTERFYFDYDSLNTLKQVLQGNAHELLRVYSALKKREQDADGGDLIPDCVSSMRAILNVTGGDVLIDYVRFQSDIAGGFDSFDGCGNDSVRILSLLSSVGEVLVFSDYVIDERRGEAVDILKRGMSDNNDSIVLESLRIAGTLVPMSVIWFQDELMGLFPHPNHVVRIRVATVVGTMGNSMLTPLSGALTSPDPLSRESACVAFGVFPSGSLNSEQIGALLKVAGDSDEQESVRVAAVVALQNRTENTSHILEVFGKIVKRQNEGTPPDLLRALYSAKTILKRRIN